MGETVPAVAPLSTESLAGMDVSGRAALPCINAWHSTCATVQYEAHHLLEDRVGTQSSAAKSSITARGEG